MHVALLAIAFSRATEIECHQLVARSISALLHELRRQIAALELHLQLPQTGVAGRKSERGHRGNGRKQHDADGKIAGHDLCSKGGSDRLRRIRYVVEGNPVTGRSDRDDVTFNPIPVMGIQMVTEHLLDRVEAVNDRHVFDDLFLTEFYEVRDAVADGVAV